MFNVKDCPYRKSYYDSPFDYGDICGKRTDIKLVCPADFTFGQGILIGCPRIEFTVSDNTSQIK